MDFGCLKLRLIQTFSSQAANPRGALKHPDACFGVQRPHYSQRFPERVIKALKRLTPDRV